MGCQSRAGGVIKFECINYSDSATGNDRYSTGSISGNSAAYSAVNTGSYSSNNVASTYGSYTADLNKVQFTSNSYTRNFFTNGKGLVDIENVPRVFIHGDSYTNNGDMVKEAMDTYGILSNSG